MIQPLLLEFLDPALERLYSDHMTRYRHKVYDRNACLASFFFTFLGNLSVITHKQLMDTWTQHLSMIMLYISLAINSLQLAFLLFLPEETYNRMRTAFCSSLRLFMAVHTAFMLPALNSGRGRDKFGFVVLYKTGILTMCYSAVMYPLQFKHHAVLQLLGTVVFMASMADSACYMTKLRPTTGEFLRQLHYGYELVASVFFGLHASMYSPRNGEASVCMATIMYTQLLLGFLLPTAAVYVFERRSRAEFSRVYGPAAVQGLPRPGLAAFYLSLLVLVCVWCMLRMYV